MEVVERRHRAVRPAGQAGARRRDEVVEQRAELALDVDVAVRAPDEPEPAVRARAAAQIRRRGR